MNSAEGHHYAWFLVAPCQLDPEDNNRLCGLSSTNILCCNLETKDPCLLLNSSQRNLESQTSIQNEFLPLKKSRRWTKVCEDEEQFKPNNTISKKVRKTPQNSQRNVIPNIMHQIISFLQKKNRSEEIVKSLIDKLEKNNIYSSKRFYLYQMLIKQKLNHYMNAQSLGMFRDLQEPLCEIYSEVQQRHYNKISLLLIRYFLTKQFDNIILTSKRVSSNKKLDHLVTKRKILELLQGIHSK